MRALATIVLGISGIIADRSLLHIRVILEGIMFRLGLVMVCGATALAAGGFFVGAVYDLSAAAWGPIAAKLLLGSVLTCLALAMGLMIGRSGTNRPRWMRRM